MTQLCNEEAEDGVIFQLHEELRTILSDYNDSCKGRCSICLENFVAPDEKDQLFTDRPDLCRIDRCFHRFHLICVYRDFFMERAPVIDEFGGKVYTKLSEDKKCPVCRQQVCQEDIEDVK